MKRILVTLAVLALLLGSRGNAFAQDWLWGVSYGFAAPTGNTKDFTNDFSWRNFGVEGRRINEARTMSIGLSASWNVFFEKTNETTALPNLPGHVTGTQYRYTNAWPILVNAHHYFGQPYRVRPFIGINVGAYIIEVRDEIGLVAAAETNVHFGGAPEIGFTVPRGRQIWFMNARYNVTTRAGNVPEQTYVTVSVGATAF
jgi:hypothetical protein